MCGTSHDPRKGLMMIKISKISHQQKSIFFIKSVYFFCLFLFYNVQKWNRRLNPSIYIIIKLIKNLRIYWVRCRLLQPYYKNNRVLLEQTENNWVFATNSNFLIFYFSNFLNSNLYFSTWWCKSLIVSSNRMHSLKYLRSTPSGCKNI